MYVNYSTINFSISNFSTTASIITNNEQKKDLSIEPKRDREENSLPSEPQKVKVCPAGIELWQLPLGILQYLYNNDIQTLGRLACTSKKSAEIFSLDNIWQPLCKNDPINIDLNLLSLKKTYKKLYKSETAHKKFKDLAQMVNIPVKVLYTDPTSVPLPIDHPAFKLKHAKKMIKHHFITHVDPQPFKWGSPLAEIHLIQNEKLLGNNKQAVQSLKWMPQNTLHCFIKPADYMKPLYEMDTEVSKSFYEVAMITSIMKTHSSQEIDDFQVKAFLDRGGKIRVLNPNQCLELNRNDHFITGCSSGVNRSQAMRAFLLKNGCQVDEVLEGGSSRLNPDAEYSIFSSINRNNADEKIFKEICGCDKIRQVGAVELEPYSAVELGPYSMSMYVYGKQFLPQHEEWFQRYFTSLKAPIHFLSFSCTGPSVIKRLLTRPGDLNDFTITFIPWRDEIAYPADKAIESYSKEALQAFMDRFPKSFSFNS